MSKQNLFIGIGTLVAGVALGGVLLNPISAQEGEETDTSGSCQQNCEQRQEMAKIRDQVNREVTKTGEGIQINLNGQDQETIDKMHEIYDESGGELGKWGMGGRGMRGAGFVDENGNGICDHKE